MTKLGDIDRLLERVADGFDALLEIADQLGIRVAHIASGLGDDHVHFVTEDGVRFRLDMRPVVASREPIDAALEAMRTAYETAKQRPTTAN